MRDNLFPDYDIRRLLPEAGAASSDYDLNPALRPPATTALRPAAVLVALDQRGGRRDLILTKRSSQLKHHPGQVALPGGKIDPEDGSAETAALREAEEEIGLPRENVRIHGRLLPHETVTGYLVTPVLAEVTEPFTPRPEPGEVEEVFRVPLDHCLNLENFRIERRRWRGEWREYYIVPWGPFYIWGATARILRNMAESYRRSEML